MKPWAVLETYSLGTLLRHIAFQAGIAGRRLRRARPARASGIRTGVVGLGGFFHYAWWPVINSEAAGLNVVALCSRDAGKLEGIRRKGRYECEGFTSYSEMLGSGINAVVILSPNNTHFRYVMMALEAGLDVLCEKPLCTTMEEMQQIRDLAARRGRIVMVGFNLRFFSRNRVLAKMIREGRIGRIERIEALHCEPRSWKRGTASETGGGILFNSGVHLVNLCLAIFGEAESVLCRLEYGDGRMELGDEHADCRIRFRCGAELHLLVSARGDLETSYETMHVYGEQGELVSDYKKSNILLIKEGRAVPVPCRKEIVFDSICNEMRHFSECVAERREPETGTVDSVRTLEVMQALYCSARRGEEVGVGGDRGAEGRQGMRVGDLMKS